MRQHITYRNTGAGGTTNLIFDTANGEFEKAWSSLAGTIRNCAGGVTPWQSWVTCEETGDADHGWCFDVGAFRGDPTPATDMGRFSHEALMVDPRTNWIYETEDTNDCGLYLFTPKRPGDLTKGGRLYMLKVRGEWQTDLGGAFPLGTTWKYEWVRIDDPTAALEPVYEQGRAKGGARFRRLEGAWWAYSRHPWRNRGYFLSTDGGQVGEGQVFEIRPHDQTLKLIYDSPAQSEAENPDNIVVTPRGSLLMCEDNSGASTNDAERLLGLTLDGKVYTFAKNNVNLTESAERRHTAGRLSAVRVGGRLLQPGRQVAVRKHSDAGYHVRHHRPVAQRADLERRTKELRQTSTPNDQLPTTNSQ